MRHTHHINLFEQDRDELAEKLIFTALLDGDSETDSDPTARIVDTIFKARLHTNAQSIDDGTKAIQHLGLLLSTPVEGMIPSTRRTSRCSPMSEAPRGATTLELPNENGGDPGSKSRMIKQRAVKVPRPLPRC